MATTFDPLNALANDTLKEVKKWGTFGGSSSSTDGFWQKPTDRELRKGKMQLGNDITSYSFKGGMETVQSILGQFPSTVVPGAKAVQVSYSQNGQPVGDIQVTVYTLEPVHEHEELEEPKDYGTDGEGNIDYDNWTMEGLARDKETRYQIVWEPAYEWPPFKLGGKILTKPEEVWIGYYAILKGYKPDDTVEYKGKKVKVQHIGSGHYKEIAKNNIFEKFAANIKILVKITTRKWKASKTAVEHGRIYAHNVQKVVNKHKVKWVTITAEGNRDDASDTESHHRSKTYTVTETIMEKTPYTGQHIPNGYTVEDMTINE